VVEKSLSIKSCFAGHLADNPRPIDFGDGGPGQMIVPEDEEQVHNENDTQQVMSTGGQNTEDGT